MPGEVTLAHQVGKDFMPVTGGSQVAYVLIEAKPTELMAQVRMPLNFALVLDHSGSMKGAKLKNVKEAVKMVIEMGKASTSVLQRRLRIGYGRAASLLDSMERDGIIGPPDGSKPRAVLINRGDYLGEP